MSRQDRDNQDANDEADDLNVATASDEEREEGPREEREYAPAAAVRTRRGFFEIYKPHQGYYCRVGTGVAAAILILWCAGFFFTKLSVLGTSPKVEYARTGLAVFIILAGGLAAYWLLALNRRICDFLIATEGEMKKVNWTSRREIFGSTKVVIAAVAILGAILFIVDVLLMLFFSSINILRIVPDILKRLLGIE